MAYQSTYQAARLVAPTIKNHFVQHLSSARLAGEQDLAPEPDAGVIEAVIDAAFWASLRREEGHPPKISIAFLPPGQAEKPLLFGQRLPLSPGALTKLAPGVERPGIHLGLWLDDKGLYLWGTTLAIPNFCFVLEVSEPGLLVIKHRSMRGFGKYTNVAVLKGDQIKIVNEHSASLPYSPAILRSLLGLSSASSRNDPVNVLIQLAVSMRTHGHGGTLLIVPAGNDSWRESIIKPMQYPVLPAFSGLADLCCNESEISENLWQSELRREVEHIAGLTAVDGASVISNRHELLAFGVKIGRAEGSPPIEQLSVIEPVIGGEAVIVHPGKIGGTRHLSAAQFVFDQHDSLALVASQDGHFTVFSWSPLEAIVQAHPIDTLLL